MTTLSNDIRTLTVTTQVTIDVVPVHSALASYDNLASALTL